MSTVVHAVTVTRPNKTGSTAWFWNQTEADSDFYDKVDQHGKTATVRRLRVDVSQALGDAVEDLIAAGEAEVVKTHDPDEPEKPEYTTLRYDTQNHEILYIERTFGGEFWPYTVEKQTNTSWLVKESGTRIGRIYQDDPTALLPSYSVELRADTDPVAYGASLQEAVEALIGTMCGDFGDVK
jgi:hypothetical protein